MSRLNVPRAPKRLARRARERFARAFGDTLARRLFLLLWVTLVGAQALAIGVVTWVRGDFNVTRMPTAPTLPPMPGLIRGPEGQPPAPPRIQPPGSWQGDPRSPGDRGNPGEPFGAGELRHDVPLPGDLPIGPSDVGGGPPPQRHGAFHGLSAWELTLDYGIRLLVTGLAAWVASRWLARPMRDLVRASQALGQSLHQQQRLALLDERRGTLEVRETAQVFNAMARQLQRQFNERGLMVAAISHDLRTPLTRLRVRLETLDIEEPQRQRSVEDIREMDALIDAVMELFRGDGPGAAEPLQDVDLGALAQALTDDLAEQAMPVRLVTGDERDEAPEAPPVLVKGQPMALRRVLGNLVGNAVRYGGSAEVQVGRDAQGPWVRVSDSGPGIPADQLEAVFEPFYRLENSRNRHTGGAGLGLYIARELTLRQRGSLVLSNRPQGGLMAELRLLPA